MDDKLYDGIPGRVLDDPDSLGEYAAFLEKERSLTTFGMTPMERADKISELRRAVMRPQLTEQTRNRIIEGIRKGHYPERAAARAGIRKAQWMEWMEQAANDVEPFSTFLSECIIAEAEAEDDLLDQVSPAMRLERRFSRPSLAEEPTFTGARWRKQTNIELNRVASSADIDFNLLKPEERARLLQAMAEAARKEAADEQAKREAITADAPLELPEWCEDAFDDA